jgi:hypothetical protein
MRKSVVTKMRPTYALGLLVILGVSLALNRPAPSTGESIQKPQNEPSRSTQYTYGNEGPTQPSSPSVTPISNPTDASQNHEKTTDISDKGGNKPSPDWVARFTGLLVLVALLQLGTFIWQIIVASDTARKQVQAYVFPVSASRYMENNVLKTKVILRNSGKTPALNCVCEVFRGIGPVVKPLPPLPDTSKLPSMRSESFIASGAEVWMIDEGSDVSHVEGLNIVRGVQAIYLIGTISYQDVFKVPHRNRYRLMCSGSNLTAGQFVFCDEGNSIE